MFGVSGAELMVILLAGLIVLGPDRLPVVARKAGKIFGDLRRMSAGFEAEVRTALFEAEHPERYRPPSAASSVIDRPVEAPDEPAEGTPAAAEGPTEPAEGTPAAAEGPTEPVVGPIEPVEGTTEAAADS